MKFLQSKYFLLACVSALLWLPSCELEEIPNPNGPTLESLVDGATAEDLQLLVSGVESVMRSDMSFYYNTVNIIGREYWDLRGTDPRYTGELLGAGGSPLDPNGFLTTRSFAANYRAVRHTYILEEAVANTVASISDEEANGFVGFAEMVRAYHLLLESNRQYQNGIRLDTRDPDNLGGFVSYEEALSGIRSLLDDAIASFGNAGGGLAFRLSSGFAGFKTPQGMAQVANALAARVAIYQGDKEAARNYLSKSFLDLNADPYLGVYHTFGASGNDQLNPLFVVPQVSLYIAHPDFLDDAEDGDQRVSNKTTELIATDDLTVPVTLDDLVGDTQITLYNENVSPVPIIRNEELMLLWAEAHIGFDDDIARSTLNRVRELAGLGELDASADLEDALLNERRYSLFGEGHRWIDLRRYDRLDEITLDRDGDFVHVQFPRPVAEDN